MSTTVEERRSLNANGGANNAPALEISGLQAWYGNPTSCTAWTSR